MKTTKQLLSYALLSGLCMLSSCTNDWDNSSNDNESVVRFSVSEEQSEDTSTRASNNVDTTPKVLSVREIPLEGGDGDICLIETTMEADPVMEKEVQTRAELPMEPSDVNDFSSYGYYSDNTFNSPQNDKLWFSGVKTSKDGTLSTPYNWSKYMPYGLFLAVSPLATTANGITVNTSTTPTIDFTVKPRAFEQQHLRTACSSLIEYKGNNITPDIPLTFRSALTLVRFKYTAEFAEKYKDKNSIAKIEIVNVYTKGTYTIPTTSNGVGTWSNLNTKGACNYHCHGRFSKTDEVYVGWNKGYRVFYMIPQTLPTDAKVYLSFAPESYYNDQKIETLTTDVVASLANSKWEPGTIKTYTLSIKN